MYCLNLLPTTNPSNPLRLRLSCIFRRRAPPLSPCRTTPLIVVPAFSRSRSPKVHALDGSISTGRESSGGDGTCGDAMDLPVDLCITYELEPAVTLREGVERIKEAVGKLKSDPPCLRSGVLRFEVRIPPSIKAASWFYSQLCSKAFPQFCVSGKHFEMASLYGIIGVAGIGASIYFHESYPKDERHQISSDYLKKHGVTTDHLQISFR